MRGTIGAPLLMFPTAWAKTSEEYVHKVYLKIYFVKKLNRDWK
jgi:hypothetical protein